MLLILCSYDKGGIIGWGKTQIFMKKPQILFTLEGARERKLPSIASIIQTAYRRCVYTYFLKVMKLEEINVRYLC